jgi:hypothetical protein
MTSPDNNPTGHRSSDAELERRARKLFHAAAQHVDPDTAARLRAMRRKTLTTANGSSHLVSRWLVPMGACAVIALTTLMIWRPSAQHAAPASIQASSDAANDIDSDSDLPPDADKTDPGLYQNLDFYGWLAANDNQSSAR